MEGGGGRGAEVEVGAGSGAEGGGGVGGGFRKGLRERRERMQGCFSESMEHGSARSGLEKIYK